MTYDFSKIGFPKIRVAKYVLKDYCSKCPNYKKCSNFSFMNIMYSKVPTILALAQLSLGKLTNLQLSPEEYTRLINYNVKYISFLEELYTQYRKSLVSVQLASFNFSIQTCVLIDEMFHIFLKWFEKLVFWNRVNSIKAKSCTYYNQLLLENINFIFELFMDSVKRDNKKLCDILLLHDLKIQFKNSIILSDPPTNNGEYFHHTEQIKDTLHIYLESLLFWMLSLDRTQHDHTPFLYISPSMLLIKNKELVKKILHNIIDVGGGKEVRVKVVTKNTTLKTDILYEVKKMIESKNKDIDVIIV